MAKFDFENALTNKDVEEIEDELTDEGIISENHKVGRIIDIDLKDIEKDGTSYTLIVIVINAKKIYERTYSVDFLRKYLKQLDITADDLIGKAVVFSVGRYNKPNGLMFVNKNHETERYELVKYIDENKADVLSRLKKLGL